MRADAVAFDGQLLKRAPVVVYKAHAFVPVRRDGDRVVVVFAEPTNRLHLDSARRTSVRTWSWPSAAAAR